ncbi:MAG: methyltransferase type 11 [Okeania sp. SIO2B3]|nr:methyltransferase type 11 [Okeania sp. SIO2B3]
MEQGLEDWEFWISAYEQGWQGYRLAKPYLYYRQHASGARNQTLYNDKNAFSVHIAKIIKLHSQLYAEEEVKQAEQILRERNISLNLLSDDNKTIMTELSLAPDIQDLLSGLPRLISNYQKEPSDRFALANLRLARKQIAELWLSLPTDELVTAYLGTLGQTHQHLLKSGIKNEPLTNSEQSFVAEILINLKEVFDKPKVIQYFLTAMLYRRPEQLPLEYDLTKIPQWLFDDYLKFLLESPILYSERGQADQYYSYLQELVDSLHSFIFSNPNSTIWQKVANEFSQNANFIPLYFNSGNLKDIYVKRAEIIESTLKRQVHQIDYEFPERGNRKKIRLGILATHFEPTAETFASLPVYEYISREYEVVLYSLKQTDRSLEQYCRGCANFFTKLPQNLKEQVNTIRADDLDILFIGTNVTAVTNQICLLALHRLARVQVTSVASVVTTGMHNIDYYISGELTDPMEKAQQHYQEQLVKLEGTAHCFSYGVETEEARVKVNRESLGISEDSVIFISGANFFKIIPEVMETWAKIIAAVPNSVLLLMPFGPNWSNAYPKKAFLEQVNNRFSQHGIVANRLIVLDPEPLLNRHDVKQYLKIADVYLDSYPFSGTSSLIEPLEVGMPIISRQGSCFRGAMGGAILRSLDVSDLVADSEEFYIDLAVALGTNAELRQQKKSEIKQKMQANPAFLDSQVYSAKIGTVFKELFQGYMVDAIRKSLRLRDINLIIFPDWSCEEEELYKDFARVLTAIASRPDKGRMKLLVDTTNISQEDADMALSSIVMNLMMEEELDVEEGPDISLVGELSQIQWEALLTLVKGKIALECENEEAIAKLVAYDVPIFQVH